MKAKLVEFNACDGSDQEESVLISISHPDKGKMLEAELNGCFKLYMELREQSGNGLDADTLAAFMNVNGYKARPVYSDLFIVLED